MERPNGEPQEILLKDLEKEYYRLSFLVDTGSELLKKEMEVSIQAGEIVGLLYDAFLNQYIDKTSEDTLKSLNMLCVRLVFCLYAEDAGVYVIDGEIEIHFNAEKFKIDKGEILMFKKDSEHKVLALKDSKFLIFKA